METPPPVPVEKLPTVRLRSLPHHVLSVLSSDQPRTAEDAADVLAIRGTCISTQQAAEALESLAARKLAADLGGQPRTYVLTASGECVLIKLDHPRVNYVHPM